VKSSVSSANPLVCTFLSITRNFDSSPPRSASRIPSGQLSEPNFCNTVELEGFRLLLLGLNLN